MTDKEKIREVIEKRYEYWKEKEFNSHSIESEVRMSECQHLLLMVDSLPEESASEDLEEEFYRFIDKEEGVPKMCNTRECIAWGVDIACHFAEWQKNKIKEAMQTEYEKGRFDMREEMMKDAVKCTWGSQATSAFMSDFPNIECGDKVKIIICKTEQQ